MGCGGSKEDVATGNTGVRRGLLRTTLVATPTSHVKSTNVAFEHGATPASPAYASAAAAAHVTRDIAVSTDGRPDADAGDREDKGAGKVAFPESPDRYFSPRKDDDESSTVDAVSEGGDFFSPRCEPDGKLNGDGCDVDLERRK